MFNNKKSKSSQKDKANKNQVLFASLNSQEQQAISGGYSCGRGGSGGGGCGGW